MPVTLWQYIDDDLDGGLKKLLTEWHAKEGIGTPTIAKRLNDMGYKVEQRTVWRWLKQENIAKKGAK
jgi:repressor of nif and glnA expression